jgi:putative oxidoreductase
MTPSTAYSSSTTYSTPAAAAPASSALARLISRVLLSALFLVAGFGKALAPAGTIAYITAAGLPLPLLSYAAALVIELGGGALLLLGYRTRLAASVLGVFSIVSALVFHRAIGDPVQLMNFLKNLAIAGGMLQVALSGAGLYSLDRRSARAG